MTAVTRIVQFSLLLFALTASLASAAPDAAEKYAQQYGQHEREARRSPSIRLELAAQLLSDARDQAADPAYQAELYLRAYDLALPEASEDEIGFATAIEAMKRLARAQPARRAEAEDKLVTALQHFYRSLRPERRKELSAEILPWLLRIADSQALAGKWEFAIALAKGTAAMAGPQQSDLASAAAAKVRFLESSRDLAAREARLRPAANTGDAFAAAELVVFLLTERDNPSAAQLVATSLDDQFLKRIVALARKGIPSLIAPEADELGSWYLNQSAHATDEGKSYALRRAVACFDRFLAAHTAEDDERARIEKLKTQAQGQLEPLAWVAQALPVDPWTREIPTTLAIAALPKTPFVVRPVETPSTRPTSPTPSTRPTAVARPTAPGRVNLLQLVDPLRDGVTGTWQQTANGMACTTAPLTRLRLAYQPPGEYDLTVNFTKSAPRGSVHAVLARGERQWLLTLGPTHCALGMVGEKGPLDKDNPTYVEMRSMVKTGQPLTLLVQVRADSIAVSLNGQLLISHKTDFADLGLPGGWAFPEEGVLGVGTSSTDAVFHRVEIKEIDAPGKQVRLARFGEIPSLDKAPPKDRYRRTVNLMSMLDPNRDLARGTWAAASGGIGFERPKLRFRYQPPEEYDFRIDFTAARESATDIDQVFMHGGRAVSWKMGTGENDICGFDRIESQPATANASTVKSPMIIVPGRRYSAVVHVRKDSIAASLNGKLVAECKLDPAVVSVTDLCFFREGVLGLCSLDKIVLHAAEVGEISGEGKNVLSTTPLDLLQPIADRPLPPEKSIRRVKLLPKINLQKDIVTGKWELRNDGLHCLAAERLSRTADRDAAPADKPDKPATSAKGRLRIAYEPPDEFNYHIRFTRLSPTGGSEVGQIVPHGDKAFALIMGSRDNTACALERLKITDGPNPTLTRATVAVRPQQTYDAVIYVRRNRVSASINGKLVADYATDFFDLSDPDGWYIGRDALGVGAESETVFHELEVLEITGQGRDLPHEVPEVDR